MLHRNNVRRVALLEGEIRRQRDVKIERIADFTAASLDADEYEAFMQALQRDLRDGAAAVYTQDELAAAWRWDELLQLRPDILRLVAELQDPRHAIEI